MKNFIERSIMGTLSFLKMSVLSDENALRNGFLQSIDPRLKTVSLVLFLVSVLFIRSILILVFLYLVCLLLAYFSKIKLGFFLKRTWVFIPLFSLFIAVPAIFATFSPGEPIFILNLLGTELIITRPGLFGALLFVVRVATSVSFIILLSQVTKHNELLSVLRIFKIPKVFVMTLGMCYRYIYLFVEIVENTYIAIKSRVGTRVHYEKGQRIVAWNIANLWQRSSQLNEEVYNAMLSRGYTGEPRLFDEFRTDFKDWAWLFCAILISISVIYLDNLTKV